MRVCARVIICAIITQLKSKDLTRLRANSYEEKQRSRRIGAERHIHAGSWDRKRQSSQRELPSSPLVPFALFHLFLLLPRNLFVFYWKQRGRATWFDVTIIDTIHWINRRNLLVTRQTFRLRSRVKAAPNGAIFSDGFCTYLVKQAVDICSKSVATNFLISLILSQVVTARCMRGYPVFGTYVYLWIYILPEIYQSRDTIIKKKVISWIKI